MGVTDGKVSKTAGQTKSAGRCGIRLLANYTNKPAQVGLSLKGTTSYAPCGTKDNGRDF